MGPLEWDDLPESSVASKRFPLKHGDKLRPVDDYSRSQVNSAISIYDQVTTDGVDVVATMVSFYMKMLADCGSSAKLLGRSLDLSSAYQQLCISEESKPYSYIAVYHHGTKQSYPFRQICLPFGSKAAVNAFIRCTRCIQWFAARCLLVPVSCYFDDFILVSTPEVSKSSESCMSLLLQLMGWAYNTPGPKADSFSQEIAALGFV